MAMPRAGMASLMSWTDGKAVGLRAPGLGAPRGAGDAVRDEAVVAGGDTDIFNFSFLGGLLSDMAPPSRSLITVSVSEPAPPPARLRAFNAADGSRVCGAEELTGAGDIGRE